jgi:hypothetical protein
VTKVKNKQNEVKGKKHHPEGFGMPQKINSSARKKRPFYGWIVVLASFLSLLVVGLIYSYGVFVDPLTQEFGWSRSSISLAFSISIFLSTLSLPFGRMSDLYGVRKVVAIGAALSGGGLLLASQISSLAQFCLSIGIAGVGISALYVPPVSAISRWFNKKKGNGHRYGGLGAQRRDGSLSPGHRYADRGFRVEIGLGDPRNFSYFTAFPFQPFNSTRAQISRFVPLWLGKTRSRNQ